VENEMMWQTHEVQRLRLSLHFFEESVVLVKYGQDQQDRASYPVALSDVAQALAGLSVGSEILPSNTLFWRRTANQERIGIYVPTRVWPVSVRTGKDAETEQLQVPVPGLLWMGQADRYWLWALKERPGSDRTDMTLYRAPAPNVMPGHHVCAGTVRFPACSGGTIAQALAMFFASQFNDHASQGRSAAATSACWTCGGRWTGPASSVSRCGSWCRPS